VGGFVFNPYYKRLFFCYISIYAVLVTEVLLLNVIHSIFLISKVESYFTSAIGATFDLRWWKQ
jgi:hypothetical protein